MKWVVLQNYARSFNNILTPSTAKPLPSSPSMLQSLPPHPSQKKSIILLLLEEQM
jgi:hypothetical protein